MVGDRVNETVSICFVALAVTCILYIGVDLNLITESFCAKRQLSAGVSAGSDEDIFTMESLILAQDER